MVRAWSSFRHGDYPIRDKRNVHNISSLRFAQKQLHSSDVTNVSFFNIHEYENVPPIIAYADVQMQKC